MMSISKALCYSVLLSLVACGGGAVDESNQSANARVKSGGTSLSQVVEQPTESSLIAQHTELEKSAVKPQLAQQATQGPINLSAELTTNSESPIALASPARSEIVAALAEAGLELTQDPLQPIKPIAKSVVVKPNPPRARQGGFTSTPGNGWIDDSPFFWNNYNFVFTGGGGSYTYAPATSLPVPPPVVPALTGLAAYVAPATRIYVLAPLPTNWATFLDTSMGCHPWCTMTSQDINPATWRDVPSEWSIGTNGLKSTITMGNDELDAFWINVKRAPVFASLAAALDRKDQRLLKAWAQLDKLLNRASITGSNEEYQYALLAKVDGGYPDVRYGYVQLKAGDVWKFGTSLDPDGRYPASVLDALNLSMAVQTRGNWIQVLTQEKVNLIGYYIQHGELPPGNKIFK